MADSYQAASFEFSPLKAANRVGSPVEDGLIGAFKPTKIPTAPSNDSFATPSSKFQTRQNANGSPFPSTPSTCARETTLKAMRAQIEAKLANERDIHASIKRRLEAASPTGSDMQGLKAEAAMRDNRISDLDRKLQKASHTLDSLQSAQSLFHNSALKVQVAEEQLQSASGGGEAASTKRGKLSKVEVTSIRSELQQATAAMSLAAKRVEQMESITDLLIEQLSEREAELAEANQLRTEEAAKHATQVEQLSSERDAMIAKLQGFKQRTAVIEAQSAEIKAQLDAAAQRADQLETVIEVADKTHSEEKARLDEQQASLTAALNDLLSGQAELQKELEDKEERLANALTAVLQGTPKGNGAKVVLPMAFQRIKETRSQLQAEQEKREAALHEANRLKAEAEAQKADLLNQIDSLNAEKERQVAEKQASLEMMTRAAATATKEAGVKQEAINKLKADIDTMTEERESLMQELEGTTNRCLKLEASLAAVEANVATLTADKNAADGEIQNLTNKLKEAEEQRTQLQATIADKDQFLTTLQASLTQLESDISSVRQQMAEQAASAKDDAETSTAIVDELEHQLTEALEQVDVTEKECDTLKERLSAHQGSIAELMDAMKCQNSAIAGMEAEMRMRDVEKEMMAGRMENAVQDLQSKLQAAQEAHADTASQLESAEQRYATSQECVSNLNQQLRHAMAINTELSAKYDSYKAQAENTIEGLKEQLISAQTAQEKVCDELAATQSQLAAKAADIDSLMAQLTKRESEAMDLQAQLKSLQEDSAAKSAALQSELASAHEEIVRVERERDRLQGNLMSLADELDVKRSEISVALKQGTPVGEGAKVVLKAAFQKIRALQSAATAAEAAVTAKAAEIASRDSKISELRDVDMKRVKELEQQATHLTKAAAELETIKSELVAAGNECEALRVAKAALEPQAAALAVQTERAAALENAMEELRSSLAAVTNELESLRKEDEAKLRALEEIAAEQVAELEDRLDITAVEKIHAIKDLAEARERLDELEIHLAEAKSQGTPQGNAAKQVVKLSFQKIRGLQVDMECQAGTIRNLESKLDAVEDNASQLATELGSKSNYVRSLQSALATAKSERDSLAYELALMRDAAESSAAAEEALRVEMAAMLEALEEADQLADKTLTLQSDNASLENALCRLRVDVQEQLEARQAAEASRDVAMADAKQLSTQVDELTVEVNSLKESLEHLAEVVATADRRLKGAQENAKGAERQWTAQLQASRRERDDAEAERLSAQTKVRELEQKLKAVSQDYQTIKTEGTPLRNAAKKATQEAMERADTAEKTLAERETAAREAEARATKLSWELREAQAELEKMNEEARKRAVAENKLAAANSFISELHSRCASHAAGQQKVSEQTQAMETALAVAREEAAQLNKLKDNGVKEAAAVTSALQASVNTTTGSSSVAVLGGGSVVGGGAPPSLAWLAQVLYFVAGLLVVVANALQGAHQQPSE